MCSRCLLSAPSSFSLQPVAPLGIFILVQTLPPIVLFELCNSYHPSVCPSSTCHRDRMNWCAFGGCVYSADFVFAAIAAWRRKCVVVVVVYPPPLVCACTNCSCLFRTCSLFCVSSNRRKCSPRSHFALDFFYPLPVSVFMSKGHTMSPPPPFYVFSLRLFPLPLLFFLLWPS